MVFAGPLWQAMFIAIGLLMVTNLQVEALTQDKLRDRSRHANIIRNIRNSFRNPRALYARASTTPCSTVRNNEGECCSVDAVQADGECCSPDEFFIDICGDSECCDDGTLYTYPNNLIEQDCCRTPGVLYYPNGGSSSQNAFCCTSGIATTTACCTNEQTVINDQCADPVRRVRRDIQTMPSKSYMVKRADTGRTLLSPDLIAEHLTSNGMFKHEGQFFMDKQHQKSNEGRLRTLAAKGIGKALRFVAGPGKLHDAAAWNSVDFVPISAEYEFAVSDVPEIYARIVAKDDFESFNWKGIAFDREILYGLASGHPAFNESLVDAFR